MQERQSVRIMVCGLVAADIIYQVKDMPRLAEKHQASDAQVSLGGGGAIAAAALSKLGASVHLISRLGDDVFAGLLRDELQARNIECSRVAQLANCQSPISSVFIDSLGERQIVNFRGNDNDQTDISDLFHLNNFTQATALNAVLVDTRWEKAALHVLQFAREQCIPAVVDAEAPVCHQAMALATHIAFSAQGLRNYADSDSLENGLRQAAAQFGNWVCVTDGENGVYYLKDDRIENIPAFSIIAVDTLGAGDAWHAAMTLQLANGASEHDAVVFANAVAALKCASPAGIDATPEYATAMALANSQLLQ